MKRIVMSFIALAFLAPAAFAQPGIVKIGGAGLLSNLTESMIEKFAEKKSACKFALVPSTTGGGFKKWLAGQAQLVQATRKMTTPQVVRPYLRHKPLSDSACRRFLHGHSPRQRQMCEYHSSPDTG